MKAFITITGLKFYFGSKPFAVGQKVKLVKEPDNEYDSEEIKAELPGLGCAGYVANSPHTVLGDCISAGRLYDKIGDSATVKVVYVGSFYGYNKNPRDKIYSRQGTGLY